MPEVDTEIDGLYPKLGAKVREILKWGDPDHRISVRVAARRTGISHTTIANMARGDRPKMGLLTQFAQGMNADVNELLRSADYIVLQPENPLSSEDKGFIFDTMFDPKRFKLDERYEKLADSKMAGYTEAVRAWFTFGLPAFVSLMDGMDRARKSRLLKNYADALLTGDKIARHLDDKCRVMFQVCLDYGYAYNNLMSLDYSLPDLKRAEPDMVRYVQHLFHQLNRMQAQYAMILLGRDEACCQDHYQYPSLEEMIGLLLADDEAFTKRSDEISKMGYLSQQEKESRKAAFEIWRTQLAPFGSSKEMTEGNPFFDTDDHWTALAHLENLLEDPGPEETCLALMYLGAYAMTFAVDYENKLSTGPQQVTIPYPTLYYAFKALESWHERYMKIAEDVPDEK